MSAAYVVGTGAGARIGFFPKSAAYDTHNIYPMWDDLQRCVKFPPLTGSERDSMFKQMVCHDIYAIHGNAGETWDFEAWRADVPWTTALDFTWKCQQWGNVLDGLTEFDGEILQGSRDVGPQKASYLVVREASFYYTRHILTSRAYGCIKAQGAPGPVVVAQDFLTDEGDVDANGNTFESVGDEFCGTPPTTTTPTSGTQPTTLPAGEFHVMNAAGGVYWRSSPDWNTPVAQSGNGVYPDTVIKVICYQAGSANVPGSDDGMWEQARWVSGSGIGSGWINEHFIADGAADNQPSPGTSACSNPTVPASPPTTPTLPAPVTYTEQETPNHPVNTFTNYHNASGQGPAVAAGQYVQVSCKVYDPTIQSVNPDGYWYRIADSPWNNAYYSPANTFMNGDPYGGPYTHNTDFNVPNC